MMKVPDASVAMTADQVRRWNQALFRRHSVRTYDTSALDRSHAAALAELQPERLNAARVRHALVEGEEAVAAIFKGLVGSYGRIVGAPALLVFIGQTLDPGFMAGVGYLGQQVLLEATALGLATCWVGGAFRREAAAQYVDLAGGEEVVCVSPVGRAAATGGLRRMHDLSLKLFTPNRGLRKPMSAIVGGNVTELWLKDALEAARWAASSYNRQPWRFAVAGSRITCTYEGPVQPRAPWPEDSRELDCGIAMLNFAVAARAREKAGQWVAVPGFAPSMWRWERG